MLKERRQDIARVIDRAGTISFAELTALFPDVSEMTLRKDLKCLDAEGRIVRIHGGARSLDTVHTEITLKQRMTQNMAGKQQIAVKAASFVRDDLTIFLDSGSTATELAKVFPDVHCTVFCGGLSCVAELVRLSKVEVCILGGMVNKSSLSVRDIRIVREVENLFFDLAFISANGFCPARGASSRTNGRQVMEQIVLHNSVRKVLLVDSSKVGKQYTYQICPPQELDAVVVDNAFPAEDRQRLENMGIEVM